MTCLIDLDGTILNFWDRYYSIFDNFFYNKLSKPEYILMRREGISEEMILNLLGIMDTKKYLKYRMERIESEHYLSFDTFYNIEKLKQFNRRILITYRKNRKNLINQLKKLKIHDFFDKIITPESFMSIQMFKSFSMRKYKEKDCIAIGDTKIDIWSAKKIIFIQ